MNVLEAFVVVVDAEDLDSFNGLIDLDVIRSADRAGQMLAGVIKTIGKAMSETAGNKLLDEQVVAEILSVIEEDLREGPPSNGEPLI